MTAIIGWTELMLAFSVFCGTNSSVGWTTVPHQTLHCAKLILTYCVRILPSWKGSWKGMALKLWLCISLADTLGDKFYQQNTISTNVIFLAWFSYEWPWFTPLLTSSYYKYLDNSTWRHESVAIVYDRVGAVWSLFRQLELLDTGTVKIPHLSVANVKKVDDDQCNCLTRVVTFEIIHITAQYPCVGG